MLDKNLLGYRNESWEAWLINAITMWYLFIQFDYSCGLLYALVLSKRKDLKSSNLVYLLIKENNKKNGYNERLKRFID